MYLVHTDKIKVSNKNLKHSWSKAEMLKLHKTQPKRFLNVKILHIKTYQHTAVIFQMFQLIDCDEEITSF